MFPRRQSGEGAARPATGWLAVMGQGAGVVRPAAEGEDTARHPDDAKGGACPLTARQPDAWRTNPRNRNGVGQGVSRARPGRYPGTAMDRPRSARPGARITPDLLRAGRWAGGPFCTGQPTGGQLTTRASPAFALWGRRPVRPLQAPACRPGWTTARPNKRQQANHLNALMLLMRRSGTRLKWDKPHCRTGGEQGPYDRQPPVSS